MTAQLFDVDPPAKPKAKADSPGPVYQGVGKSIRYLRGVNADPEADAAFGTSKCPEGSPGSAWATRMAGTIAQATSLASSIDRASGRDPQRRQAAGRDLAVMHEQLDALMLRLDPEGVAAGGTDSWEDTQRELAELELAQRRQVMAGEGLGL